MEAEAFVVGVEAWETWEFWRSVIQIVSTLVFVVLIVWANRRGNRYYKLFLQSEHQNFVLHQELIRIRMQFLTATEELDHIRRVDEGAHTAALIGGDNG